jgi:hypothetical protein
MGLMDYSLLLGIEKVNEAPSSISNSVLKNIDIGPLNYTDVSNKP